MLEIRPNCEYCDIDLAANSADARICSYECTYCRQCVEQILHNVCPNCGGGFVARPIRPLLARREGVSLTVNPRRHTESTASIQKMKLVNLHRRYKTFHRWIGDRGSSVESTG